MAGALMGFTEIIQFTFVLMIGCIVGLFLGGLSLWNRKKMVSIGLAGLILNSLPIIALLYLILRDRI
jgi:drug/metabolite transporter (DMT)-like permease